MMESPRGEASSPRILPNRAEIHATTPWHFEERPRGHQSTPIGRGTGSHSNLLLTAHLGASKLTHRGQYDVLTPPPYPKDT
jgi:hypothetical protein